MAKQKKAVKNIPKTQEETTNDSIFPQIPSLGKPSMNLPKRGNDVSMRGEEIKDISVGIEDIDSALFYYFNNVIKPIVINEGTKQAIPIVYADSERWNSAQKEGHYRDKEGKMLFPVITIKRDSLEKNRTVGNKLDGNKTHLYQVYEKKYTRKNQYDNFAILMNRVPVKEFYNVVIPDYYTITYSCAIYVSFMEDMNKIIESIGFRSDSYWGEKGKFMFKARIDSFGTTTTVADGEDRKIVSNFTIVMYGYLTPNNLDRHLATDAFKFRNKTQVLFTLEASNQDVESVVFTTAPNAKSAVVSYIPEGVNVNSTVIVQNTISGSLADVVDYLNTNITKKADYVGATYAAYYNATMKQPPATSGLDPTSIADFKFFANGVYIDATHIVSFIPSGSALLLTVDTGSLMYDLLGIEEIIAVGKFI